MSETPLLSRSSRSSSSASSSSSSLTSLISSPILNPLSKSPSYSYKLPSPVSSSSNKKSNPNKRKFRSIVLQLLALIVVLSWVTYPFVRSSSSSQIISLKIHPAVESLISKTKTQSPSGHSHQSDLGRREAYVTFLSSISDTNYLLSTRLLIYQLLHDPLTRDSTSSRDVVVLTTPHIDMDTEDLLKKEGAVVHRVELLDGFDLPDEVNGHWKDQYTKLNIFNLTTYDEILYLDNDVLLLKSLEDIWNSEGSDLPHGIGGVGENSKIYLQNSDLRIPPPERLKAQDKDYLNAGFMLIRPEERLFESLRATKGYDTFYMEQALINQYASWEGNHPWTPLNHLFVSHFPKTSDTQEGYHSLHAKMWKDPVTPAVKRIWEEAVGRMEEYWRWHDEE
ncbi:hypothetical protein I203_101451 [Kwoniella mangroviensis CBS 8507]